MPVTPPHSGSSGSSSTTSSGHPRAVDLGAELSSSGSSGSGSSSGGTSSTGSAGSRTVRHSIDRHVWHVQQRHHEQRIIGERHRAAVEQWIDRQRVLPVSSRHLRDRHLQQWNFRQWHLWHQLLQVVAGSSGSGTSSSGTSGQRNLKQWHFRHRHLRYRNLRHWHLGTGTSGSGTSSSGSSGSGSSSVTGPSTFEFSGYQWQTDSGTAPPVGNVNGNVGTFDPMNVSVGSELVLSLTQTQQGSSTILSSGSEVMSKNTFTYGTFEFTSRVVNVLSGSDSSGFLYTGNSTPKSIWSRWGTSRTRWIARTGREYPTSRTLKSPATTGEHPRLQDRLAAWLCRLVR